MPPWISYPPIGIGNNMFVSARLLTVTMLVKIQEKKKSPLPVPFMPNWMCHGSWMPLDVVMPSFNMKPSNQANQCRWAMPNLWSMFLVLFEREHFSIMATRTTTRRVMLQNFEPLWNLGMDSFIIEKKHRVNPSSIWQMTMDIWSWPWIGEACLVSTCLSFSRHSWQNHLSFRPFVTISFKDMLANWPCNIFLKMACWICPGCNLVATTTTMVLLLSFHCTRTNVPSPSFTASPREVSSVPDTRPFRVRPTSWIVAYWGCPARPFPSS
mmetsp:Transcript_5731/g.12729  ORF Transcript_5731/g.12729 Transcript_5731/m.12729 type:complete len:268 (-) Transcript_5731:1160-1963(-)